MVSKNSTTSFPEQVMCSSFHDERETLDVMESQWWNYYPIIFGYIIVSFPVHLLFKLADLSTSAIVTDERWVFGDYISNNDGTWEIEW